MINTEIKIKKINSFFIGSAFLLFLLICTYKLTNSSLWYDETVEYWHSKIMTGTIPFNTVGTEKTYNMYQRIISTFQPPLYNVLVYFWLKISDSVWWFRFFGVVTGFIGMIGLYKSIRKATDNSALASCSVVFSTFVYQLLYYWQECSEYCLLLCSLFWTVYCWISVMKNPSRKNIIGFAVLAVISVYSQYGAVFPVAVMGLTAFIKVCMLKDKRRFMEILCSFGAAVIFAALPLYVFFIRKQLEAQSEVAMTTSSTVYDNNIVKDQINHFQKVFKWNLFSYYSDTAVWILLVIVLIMTSVVLFKGSKVCRILMLINLIIWELYYFSVRLGIYSYGNFGNRYNLFFIPIWIVSFFVIIYELYHILNKAPIINTLGIPHVFIGAAAAFCLCFCTFGWNERIENNWYKEEARNVTEEWLNHDGRNTPTLIYYGANSGFGYYIRSYENYDPSWENNVTYMPWFRTVSDKKWISKSEEEWTNYLNGIYRDNWPDQIYVVLTHLLGDESNILSKQFINKGYEKTELYKEHGGYLYKFSR